jgi:hypothetical protein
MRLSGLILPLALLLAASSGCSTWRCRGFVDSCWKFDGPTKESYVIDTIEFVHLAGGNAERRELSPELAWLSSQDGLTGSTYLEDVSASAGLTNVTPASVPVQIKIIPINEQKSGWETAFWPLGCTLGMMPAHFVESVPFDVIVQFGGQSKSAYASVGMVRTDMQCGLSRYDMDAPPPASGAVCEIRDEGTVGTGKGLRVERLRQVFVSVLASAVRSAIAQREGLVCHKKPLPSTEFGSVVFPEPDLSERDRVEGFGAERVEEPVKVVRSNERSPAKVVSDSFFRNAWENPSTETERKLKSMVESGFMSREEWRRRINAVRKGEQVR